MNLTTSKWIHSRIRVWCQYWSMNNPNLSFVSILIWKLKLVGASNLCARFEIYQFIKRSLLESYSIKQIHVKKAFLDCYLFTNHEMNNHNKNASYAATRSYCSDMGRCMWKRWSCRRLVFFTPQDQINHWILK